MSTMQPVSSPAEMLRSALLALLCARLYSTAPDPALLPAADDREGWMQLVALAHSERVSPLVYLVLKDSQLCPPEALAALRGVYYNTLQHNTRLFGQVEQIAAVFQARGVGLIVLKGMALAESLYHNPGLRPVTDIDLLVRPADVPAAAEELARLGWQQSGEQFRGPQEDYRHELQFLRAGTPAALELHWGLFQPWFYKRVIPPDQLWGTARPLPQRGSAVLELGPEACLVYIAAHRMLQHSGGGGLLWLFDLALMAQDPALDWERVLADTRGWGLVLSVRPALAEIERVFGVRVPPRVTAALAKMRPGWQERYAYKRFVAGELSAAGIVFTMMLEMRGSRERARYLWQKVFPPAAYMLEHYHIRRRWLLPFYYPYRMLIGLRRQSSPRHRA